MSPQAYEIHIAADSVDVVEESSKPHRDRIESSRGIAVGGFVLIGLGLFTGCVALFAHDKYSGLANWQALVTCRWPSRVFVEALIELSYVGCIAGFLLMYGVRLFFPYGARLHSDKTTFAVSRIPWLNLRGQWKTQSFPIASIHQLRTAISPKRSRQTFYCLRFLTNERKRKLFPYLALSQAHSIVKGLRALGLDAPHDPDMPGLIKLDADERRASLDYPRPRGSR